MRMPRPAERPRPAVVLTRRVLELAPDPSAARSTRRMLAGLVAEVGREAWGETAELASTELVTNAVLHAHTAITVTAEVRPDELYVAVSDRSHDLPKQRAEDTVATTGRGMLLVARLVSEHGVRRDDAGKTVWFTLRGEPAPEDDEATHDDLLSLWDDDPPEGPEAGPPGPGAGATSDLASVDGPARVSLLDFPPTLWLAAAGHHQTVLRELVLYAAEHPDDVVDMPAVDSARTVLDDAVEAALAQAAADGTARRPLPDDHPAELPWVPGSLTLGLDVPPGWVSHFAALQDALDLAERLAEDGRLLARPGLPEVVALRDWACEQVQAQVGGAPAAPWPGTDHERFLGRDAGHDRTGWDVAVVRSATRAVVAADDSNRVVAVSTAMAEVVGWEVDDLVGRRVVTLIPARLREGHVAGFSRHLSTGEARLLGVPLELPVLRADGSEVRCRVLIEEAAAQGGRRLYLAWFDPVLLVDPVPPGGTTDVGGGDERG